MIELSKSELTEVLDWACESGHHVTPLFIRLKGILAQENKNFTMRDFQQAWERHAKRNGKVYQVVLQTVIGKSEQIDWDRFNSNHPLFCDYWNRRGWNFCGETLIDWIDNGCCAPPPEVSRETPNTRLSRIANRQR